MPRPMSGRRVLTREERRELLNYHVRRLRDQLGKVEKARGPLSAEQDTLTGLVHEAKAELGKSYTRKRLMEYVADSRARTRDLVGEETQRAEDRGDLGLPVYGLQPDLFPPAETPQEAKDELAWEADGYLAGRRAAERKAPDDVPRRFVQPWLKGHDKGQQENAGLLAAASKTRKRLAQPPALDDGIDMGRGEVVDLERSRREKGKKPPAPQPESVA